MNSYLQQIISQGFLISPEGEKIKIHSHVSEKEGEMIQKAIHQTGAKTAVEVGCAFGISSLYISDALQKSAETKHYVIDPMQLQKIPGGWSGFGLYNLKKAGFEQQILFMNLPGHLALAQLELDNVKVDFGFIDGWHTFDHTLVDFFHIDRILKPGGLLAIDDTFMPSVKKVVSFILHNRSYKIVDFFPAKPYPWKRNIANKIHSVLNKINAAHPYLATETFGGKIDKLTRGDFIILQKEKDDERNWDSFENF